MSDVVPATPERAVASEEEVCPDTPLHGPRQSDAQFFEWSDHDLLDDYFMDDTTRDTGNEDGYNRAQYLGDMVSNLMQHRVFGPQGNGSFFFPASQLPDFPE